MKTAKVRQISVKVNNTGMLNDFKVSFGHLPQSKRRWLEKKTDLKNYLSDISQASTGSEESVQS